MKIKLTTCGNSSNGSKTITMCGYRCDLCKAYAPNIKKKDERIELSKAWKKYYGLSIQPDDIYCDGCRNMNKDAKRIDMGCIVRTCVMEKGLEHCGDCEEFPCVKFGERRGLSYEKAKEEQGSNFDEEEYDKYLKAFDNETRLKEYRLIPRKR